MSDQATTTGAGGAPGGSPAGNAPAPSNSTPANTGGSFLRTRIAQLAQTMQQPQGAPGEQPAADAGRQQQQPQPQSSPPGQTVDQELAPNRHYWVT